MFYRNEEIQEDTTIIAGECIYMTTTALQSYGNLFFSSAAAEVHSKEDCPGQLPPQLQKPKEILTPSYLQVSDRMPHIGRT